MIFFGYSAKIGIISNNKHKCPKKKQWKNEHQHHIGYVMSVVFEFSSNKDVSHNSKIEKKTHKKVKDLVDLVPLSLGVIRFMLMYVL